MESNRNEYFMKIICVGHNYISHIKELGSEMPVAPTLFIKPDSAVIQQGYPFVIPSFSKEVHHEIELAIRIEKIGKHIDPPFAHKYYDKIGLGLDFTARDLQKDCKRLGLPWEKAKAFDGSAFVSPWIEKEKLPTLKEIHFELKKNGNTIQKGRVSDMLFEIDALICYISKFFTLKIGDIIFTGTPSGVSPVRAKDVLEGILCGKKLFELAVK